MITTFVTVIGILMGVVSIMLLEVLDSGKLKHPFSDYMSKYRFTGSASIIILTCLFNLLYYKFGLSWAFLRLGILFFVLLIAALYDFRYKLIPNLLVYCALPLGILLSVSELSIESSLDSVIGAITGGGILLILYFITKGGVGKGDALLFSCAGAYLGLTGVINAMVMSALISGLFGVIMIIIKKYTRKSYMPFAPFILASCVVAILNM